LAGAPRRASASAALLRESISCPNAVAFEDAAVATPSENSDTA
jgi:hypothetical protein